MSGEISVSAVGQTHNTPISTFLQWGAIIPVGIYAATIGALRRATLIAPGNY
jgi:hypothetical protein